MTGTDEFRELRRRTVRNHIFFWVLLPVGLAVLLYLLAVAEVGGLTTAWGAVYVVLALPVFLLAGAFEIGLLFLLDRAKKLSPELRAVVPVAVFGLFVIPYLIPPWQSVNIMPVVLGVAVLGAMYFFNLRYWKKVARLRPTPEPTHPQ